MIVGVVFDSCKLPSFKKNFDAAGYVYTQHPGITKDNLLDITNLVRKADKEARNIQRWQNEN